jgi:DNA-binding NtrC family response regulator
VIDDEEGIRAFLAESLERDGHEVVQAADGADGLAAARDEPFDVVLTDLRMPNVDGMTVVRTLRTDQPTVEVVVLTAFGDVSSAVEAMKLGAFDYLQKPLESPAKVRDLVAAALARRAELGEPSSGVPAGGAVGPELTFGAPAMRAVIDALGRVARSNASVLLQGESGTGKEVAARAIHAKSPRAAEPFVAINCAVLTEHLLESELFGHEKGAFTGAHAQRRGRIELADKGTFFLDEVGELHLSLQAKLLRVLEERTFERVGGSHAVEVDVRWIAATHRDLRVMVREGAFREDLYHRLAVFPIRLPPLRERTEDILPIAESLLATLARSGGRSAPRLSERARARLLREAWPGNVRELRNVLERALILSDGATLEEEHLWIEPAAASSDDDAGAASGSLTDLERRAIERALAASGGNRKAAAAKLGIGLRTLYEKLKRYDLR